MYLAARVIAQRLNPQGRSLVMAKAACPKK
jgi:hypothetical protein